MNIKRLRISIDGYKDVQKRMSFFIWSVLYRVLLDIAYSQVIGPKFQYIGFIVKPTLLLKLYSWIIFLVFAGLAHKCYLNKNRLSNEILFVLFLLSVVPGTTLMAYGQYPQGFIICFTVYWLTMFLVHRLLVLGDMHFLSRGRNKAYYRFILFAIFIPIALVILYISARYTNFRLHFNLLTVYDLRDEASGYAIPTILKYLYAWSRVAMPIFISYFFIINRKILAWGCFGLQMLNFGIEGSKTVFFMAVFAVIIAHLPKIDIGFINRWVLKGLVCLYGACILFYQLTENIVPISMFMRRVLFGPAYLQWAYYDFFLDKVPEYFRSSFLRHFGFKSPYPNLDNIIGGLYSYSSATNANNGLISDAITNFGYIGVFIMPIFLCLIFCVLDDSSKNLDARIYILVSLYLTISLTNTFLNTILLTHGLLIVIFLLFFMRRDFIKTFRLRKRFVYIKRRN